METTASAPLTRVRPLNEGRHRKTATAAVTSATTGQFHDGLSTDNAIFAVMPAAPPKYPLRTLPRCARTRQCAIPVSPRFFGLLSHQVTALHRIMTGTSGKIMATWLRVFSLLMLLPGIATPQPAGHIPADNNLTLLNWSEYMDPELIIKFEKQYDARVTEIYYESDDYRDNYMLETQGVGIDVIVVNGIQIRSYIEQDWIAPLTVREVSNLRHIDRKWLTLFPEAEGYTVPHFWGTSGIVYRKDLVDREIRGWKDLLNPDEEWRGKITMVGSSRDLIGIALKALGYSHNSTDPDELKEAHKLLLKQKPYVKEYSYITLDENSSMVRGDVVIAMIYSGDALMLQQYSDKIEYVVPEEGAELWVDHMVVSQASKKKKLAYEFINFLNEPEHAAQLAQYVYYATPNRAAEALLPDDFLSDQTIYPPKNVLNKSDIYKPLPPMATRLRNEIFSSIIH